MTPKEITFTEFVELVKTVKDDPLQQIMSSVYHVDGYIVRLNGDFVQWMTPVETHFSFGLPIDEFLSQAELAAG